MTATDPPAAVAAYYAAFRSGDVESWLAVFARDAEVANPAGAPPLHGAASLRELWEELTCPFRCVDLTEGLVVVTDGGVAVTWTARAVPWAGDAVRTEGIDVFRLDDSGRVAAMTSYWDPPQLRAQLCGAPAPG